MIPYVPFRDHSQQPQNSRQAETYLSDIFMHQKTQ